MKRIPFAAYNLAPPGKPNRGPAFVDRELNALANNVTRVAGRMVPVRNPMRRRPKVLALTEAIGHRTPPLAHYGKPIRSFTSDGRANLALYVRDGLEGPPAEWVQHRETWPRTEHPGAHPARATLVKELDGVTVIVGHGPPNVRGAGDARDEWVAVTARLLRQYRRVVWLGDPNGLLAAVRQALGDDRAAIGGDATDAVLVRGFVLVAAATPASVNGVPMLTDHRKALLGTAVRR